MGSHSKNDNIMLSQKLKDMESELSQLRKQKMYLEDRANRNKKNLAEMNDIVTENEDLQQAMIRKDKVIEELEKQISMIIRDSDVKMKRNMEKMRIEYELMARSAMSHKMRKMNEYLDSKLKQQENLDHDKENISKAIQIDLEERLMQTSSELSHINTKLKKTESELKSLRSEMEMKQKILDSEQSQRKQLEVQVNRLTNSRICDRMMKGSLDNLPRHSLETPIMSPELRREPTYNQTRYLYYK